jgi:hypothetical protein
MRPLARPLVRGAGLIAAIALTACAGGGSRRAEDGPAPAPTAAGPSHPIDTVGLPRIRFAHGTTSGLLDDSLAAGATRSYALFAQQGQVMLAHAIGWPVAERLHPPPEPVVRVFEAATGRELPSPRAEPEVWSARLPLTGGYVVRVTAAAPTTYTLSVQIPRRVEVSQDQATAIFTGSAPSRAPRTFSSGDAGRTPRSWSAARRRSACTCTDWTTAQPPAWPTAAVTRRIEASQDYVVSVIPGVEGAAYDLRITLR